MSKKNTLVIWITVLMAFVLLGLYFFLFPRYGRYFPKCPLYSFTHIYCPGCGSQRAIAGLSHGRLLEALHQNVLVVLALPVLVYRWLLLFRKEGTLETFFLSKWFPKVLLVIVLLFTLLRNLPIGHVLAPY